MKMTLAMRKWRFGDRASNDIGGEGRRTGIPDWLCVSGVWVTGLQTASAERPGGPAFQTGNAEVAFG